MAPKRCHYVMTISYINDNTFRGMCPIAAVCTVIEILRLKCIDLDLSRSLDVICHVTIWLALCGF